MSYISYSRSAPQPLPERQVDVMVMRNRLMETYPNPSDSNKVGLLTGIVILLAWSTILLALFSVI